MNNIKVTADNISPAFAKKCCSYFLPIYIDIANRTIVNILYAIDTCKNSVIISPSFFVPEFSIFTLSDVNIKAKEKMINDKLPNPILFLAS